jgi:tetratricopeptide (TPR) repeat protein
LKKPLSRRLVLGAAGGATILSCIYAIRRYMSREAPLPESPKLMLTACTHMPGDKDREIAATVDTLLRTQLQQSAHVSLLSKAQMQEAWERITGKRDRFPESIEPAKARHTAMRAGAQFVLFGGLTQVGDTKALQLDLELLGSDPATPRRTWPQSFAANRDSDLPSAVFEGTAWLRQVTGETAQALSMHQRHPQDLTTGSWQALLEFQRAEDAWSAGAGDAALLHLRTALDLDPEFALAAARMADILESLHRRDEGLPYYNRAAELIRGKNLTDRESLRIAGLFALDTGQFSEAERVFTRFALEYPKDPLPLFYKATAVDCLGRGDEALQLAQNAFSMEPTSYAYIMLRAIFLLNRGQFREAEEDLGHAARLKTGDWTDQLRSALAMAHGDLPEVWRSLEKMRTSGSLPYRSRAYGFEACIMAERGDLGAAQRLLKDGMDFDRRMGTGAQAEFTRNRMFAQIALRQGEKRKAIGICRLMLNGDPALENTMSVGCLLAQAGETAAARRCLPAEMPAWPTYLHWQQRLKGELALSEGRPLEALASMKAAPPSHIHYEWPEYVARAAIAARDMATLRGCLMPLLTNPARYWLQGDTTGPGFIRWACETAERAELPPKELVLARSLKKLLNKSVS